MSPNEVVNRSSDLVRQRSWTLHLPRCPEAKPKSHRTPIEIPSSMAARLRGLDTHTALQQADRLLEGHWKMFGLDRTDVDAEVDYYYDPATQKRAPSDQPAFRINHRDENSIGNIKNIWELARHQHLTSLAAAYTVSKDERYAQRISQELTGFIHATPFCQGIHWTSGIELGIRMISWVWIRRLLDEWPEVGELFEHNPDFIAHLGRHHQWINSFPANGSSANNHLIAESCGTFVAASAFDFFNQGDRWREQAASTLVEEFDRQTFSDGLNKELASDYHGFVLELVITAYAEARLTNHPLADQLIPTLTRAFDAIASIVDCAGNAHHQGDADDGYGLLLEPAGFNRWHSLLATGAAIIKQPTWWPDIATTDLRTEAIRSCDERNTNKTEACRSTTSERPTQRINQFTEAGQTILRDLTPRADEIWVRFDHGPHGYLSTAAHAHADSLSIEARIGGKQILVDPGTYCYHGEPQWRDYFRSTASHSTVEIGGQNQSQIKGPFLWGQHCSTTLEACDGLDHGDAATCSASHDGYVSTMGVRHHRSVTLDRQQRSITIADRLASTDKTPDAAVKVLFHFHPDVEVEQLDSPSNDIYKLTWTRMSLRVHGTPPEQAKLEGDPTLNWSLVKGKTEPPLGWYSHILGHREPCWVLVGETTVEAGSSFSTTLTF